MYINYLSKEEDEIFSKAVIDFNTKNYGCENEELKKKIKDRTRILIYRISKELLHLSYDDASTVYLALEEDLDRIISSYKVSRASFNQYLKQICQYRCRRIRKRKYENILWENAYFREEAQYNAKTWAETDYFEIKRNIDRLYRPEDYREYDKMSLKEIVEHIAQNRNAQIYPLYNEMETKLRDSLNKRTLRKRFLIFLLSLPKKSEYYDYHDIARVLETKEIVISRFFELKDHVLGNNESRILEAQARAVKHWRIMRKLEANIMNEGSEEKRKRLQDHYLTQVACHRKKVLEIKKASRGLSRTEIADILNVSRSTVSGSIREITNLLESIVEN